MRTGSTRAGLRGRRIATAFVGGHQNSQRRRLWNRAPSIEPLADIHQVRRSVQTGPDPALAHDVLRERARAPLASCPRRGRAGRRRVMPSLSRYRRRRSNWSSHERSVGPLGAARVLPEMVVCSARSAFWYAAWTCRAVVGDSRTMRASGRTREGMSVRVVDDDEDARFRARFVASATRKGGSSFRAEGFERAGAHLRRIILRLRHGEGPGRALRARSTPRGGECGAFTGSFVVSRPLPRAVRETRHPPKTATEFRQRRASAPLGLQIATRPVRMRSARALGAPRAVLGARRASPRCVVRAAAWAGASTSSKKLAIGFDVGTQGPKSILVDLERHRRRAWKLCGDLLPTLASERGGAGSRDVDGRHPRYPEAALREANADASSIVSVAVSGN